MTVSIKARFEKQVRRTSLDNDELKYSELFSTLSQLFGPSFTQQTQVKYLDDEGEWVDISSDNELKEALRLNKGTTLQLVAVNPRPKPQHCFRGQREGCRRGSPLFPFSFEFVQEPTKSSSQPVEPQDASSKPEEFVHPAFCDSCNSKIVGLRHKCEQCPDYDLCNKCIEKKDQVHEVNHVFKPLEKSFPVNPLQQFLDSIFQNIEVALKEEKKEGTAQEQVPEEKKEEVQENPESTVVPPSDPVEFKPESTSNATVSSPASSPKVEKEGSQVNKQTLLENLNQLESMGFTDREKNIKILLKNQGNMANSVVQLLGDQ